MTASLPTSHLIFMRSLAGAVLASALAMPSGDASAQTPPPSQLPNVSDNAAQLSAGAGLLDLGGNFLQRLGREASTGYALRDNSGGGGAAQDMAAVPLYRGWLEGYGISARTGAQGDFTGDRRTTAGGVGGIGMTIAPGFHLGVAVDHSRTDIDVPLALQSGRLDMTQIGVNGAYSSGPWTAAFAAVHGAASIRTSRATMAGAALADYRGRVDGVLGELSYYHGFDQSRLVPKLGIEYVVASTDGYREFGGLDPVDVGHARSERARMLIGAEIGHYWIVGRQIVDVSAYGKFVDNFFQDIGSVQVSLGRESIAVQGVRESRSGADAGAGLSWSMSAAARLYANYDGRFRDSFTSHQGTLGFELKW